MDGGGDDAPDGGSFGHIAKFGDGELASSFVPPYNNIGFAWVEGAVDNCNVAIKNPCSFPFVTAHAEHVGAGGVLYQ